METENQEIQVNRSINDLITYSVTDAAITELRERLLPLKVAGLDDQMGYAACKKGRLEVKGIRVAVEKRRKELKQESLDFGRMVDSEAKRITADLEAIESHLEAQQAIIDNEKKRIEEEAAAKAEAKFRGRVAQLQEWRARFDLEAVRAMSDEAFDAVLAESRAAYEAEVAAAKAERERLRVLEEERKAQAEQLRLQEQENQRLRDEVIAKQRAELAEQQRVIDEQKAAAEAAEREARRVEAERQRAEKEAREAEERRIAQEAAARQKREREAARQIQDRRLFEEIKVKFPTIESAWIEIARLMGVQNSTELAA